jgi:hypothetical protein
MVAIGLVFPRASFLYSVTEFALALATKMKPRGAGGRALAATGPPAVSAPPRPASRPRRQQARPGLGS